MHMAEIWPQISGFTVKMKSPPPKFPENTYIREENGLNLQQVTTSSIQHASMVMVNVCPLQSKHSLGERVNASLTLGIAFSPEIPCQLAIVTADPMELQPHA